MQNCRAKILGFTLLLAGLAMGGTGLWLLLSPAQYRATTMIELKPDLLDISGTEQGMYYDPYFLQTEFEIIKSPNILGKVVEALNLNLEWGKKHGDGSPLKTAKAIELLQRRMNLEPVRNTTLIKISFTSEDPNEAARIANAIAKAYQGYRLQKLIETTERGIRALEDEYQKQEQDIKAKQENLVQLRKQLNLPNPEPADELLKTNYPAYFQAKQELQKMMDLHKQILYRIETLKIDLAIPRRFLHSTFNMLLIKDCIRFLRTATNAARCLFFVAFFSKRGLYKAGLTTY